MGTPRTLLRREDVGVTSFGELPPLEGCQQLLHCIRAAAWRIRFAFSDELQLISSASIGSRGNIPMIPIPYASPAR